MLKREAALSFKVLESFLWSVVVVVVAAVVAAAVVVVVVADVLLQAEKNLKITHSVLIRYLLQLFALSML